MMNRNPYASGGKHDATLAAATRMTASPTSDAAAAQQGWLNLRQAAEASQNAMLISPLNDDQLSEMYTKSSYVLEGQGTLAKDEESYYQSQDGETRSKIETIIWETILRTIPTPRLQSDTFAIVMAGLVPPIAKAPTTADDQLASVYSKPSYITPYGTTVFSDREREYYQNIGEDTQKAIRGLIRQSVDAKIQTVYTADEEYKHAVATLQTAPASVSLPTPQRSLTDPVTSGNHQSQQNMISPSQGAGGASWDDGPGFTEITRSSTLPSYSATTHANPNFSNWTYQPR